MRLRDGKSTNEKKTVYVEKEQDNECGEEFDMYKSRAKNVEAHIDTDSHVYSNLSGDYLNVSLLFLLYILQGIPLGLAGSIPMILQNKNISYKQQAMFSFVYWPFSLKLLWAPIVDAAFLYQFGRRKTWLVPVQYLIGFFMFLLSMRIDSILNREVPNVFFLTVIFFVLNFLAATQDIAVDGWALTMLKKRNVGYASTCNSVGQTAGYFLGNVVLIAFSSADFCNKYLRSVPQKDGIITLAGFLFFWGIVFLVTTTMVWIFKHEKDDTDGEDYGIVGTYMLLLKIAKLPAVQELVIILLTIKIGFAAADAVTGLKLIEAGVKKETLALLAVPLVPLQILLPLVISKFTAGPRPLDVFKKAIPFRLLMGLVFAVLVYWTHHVRVTDQEEFPYYYFVVILFMYALHQTGLYTMAVSFMSFNSKVSVLEYRVGGTYMTFFNTMTNLGTVWTKSAMLYFVDGLTWRSCIGVLNNDCNGPGSAKACTDAGGKCETTIDGYYIESALCVVLGFLWLLWRRRSLTHLQNLKEAAWKVT